MGKTYTVNGTDYTFNYSKFRELINQLSKTQNRKKTNIYEDIAVYMHVSTASVNHWVYEHNSVGDIDTVKKLAEFFKTDYMDLLERINRKDESNMMSKAMNTVEPNYNMRTFNNVESAATQEELINRTYQEMIYYVSMIQRHGAFKRPDFSQDELKKKVFSMMEDGHSTEKDILDLMMSVNLEMTEYEKYLNSIEYIILNLRNALSSCSLKFGSKLIRNINMAVTNIATFCRTGKYHGCVSNNFVYNDRIQEYKYAENRWNAIDYAAEKQCESYQKRMAENFPDTNISFLVEWEKLEQFEKEESEYTSLLKGYCNHKGNLSPLICDSENKSFINGFTPYSKMRKLAGADEDYEDDDYEDDDYEDDDFCDDVYVDDDYCDGEFDGFKEEREDKDKIDLASFNERLASIGLPPLDEDYLRTLEKEKDYQFYLYKSGISTEYIKPIDLWHYAMCRTTKDEFKLIEPTSKEDVDYDADVFEEELVKIKLSDLALPFN